MKDVLKIADGVLKECTDKDVESVVIPEGVTEIGGCAFKGCKSLASVEIPSSVTAIGGSAFYGCESLKSVVIPSSVTKIGESAFEGCTSLSSVALPEEFTEIGDRAFKGCNISEISHPCLTIKGGLVIEYSELLYCTSQSASITIPEGVAEIGGEAFYGCTSLSSVSIPSSVKKIGDGSFYGCESLSSVEFGGTMAQWDAVKGKMWLLDYSPAKSVKCADGEWQKSAIVENGVLVEYTDKDAASVEIPDGVTEIGGLAFRDCSSLESVSIPSSVAEIGEYAFFHCSSLTSIEFGGTAAQWEAVEKGDGWNYGFPATTVKCSDGEAEL
ncbi:leucine-rich repeat domain-containing protein [Treponema saccharophilum]|uniref:Surface antigen BspA n=1 Tax=Treponema saccharophilum DSM 2985 TaxID=907348 RepID=H7EJU2_9SPIR|nr:leucine-rich repeat domain-containing protein [Treponema saccharophilum]EIC02212.1 hypothetical protein TresaDRAFT_2192 [Treponema saccharophilum DSM 2985]BDC96664.1 hypothetical protein TRSA_17630 [Treponema saccharophilum]